jgi:hypothetical protein
MNRKISYAFQDDGVYALENGSVIAHAETMADLELKLAADDKDDESETLVRQKKLQDNQCPDCGYNVENCKCEEGQHTATIKAATHVVTPNGLKGKIMGSVVPGVWGDEVTVRFANGHIARLEVTEDFQFTSDAKPLRPVASAKASSADRITFLREKLAETADGDSLGLKTRLADLQEIQEIATELASRRSASDEDVTELDTIRAEASYEASEVNDALAYLNDAEPYREQHRMGHVVEQEHVGRGNSGWLDQVAQDMIHEAESTDFDKLLNEGPSVFVADLESGPLADQGVTATLATSFIESKIAAARPEIREKITELWVERVEDARRETYANRKQTMSKAASVETDIYENLPDEVLFS